MIPLQLLHLLFRTTILCLEFSLCIYQIRVSSGEFSRERQCDAGIIRFSRFHL